MSCNRDTQTPTTSDSSSTEYNSENSVEEIPRKNKDMYLYVQKRIFSKVSGSPPEVAIEADKEMERNKALNGNVKEISISALTPGSPNALRGVLNTEETQARKRRVNSFLQREYPDGDNCSNVNYPANSENLGKIPENAFPEVPCMSFSSPPILEINPERMRNVNFIERLHRALYLESHRVFIEAIIDNGVTLNLLNSSNQVEISSFFRVVCGFPAIISNAIAYKLKEEFDF